MFEAYQLEWKHPHSDGLSGDLYIDDDTWIGVNLTELLDEARHKFAKVGRGIIIVDRSQRRTGDDHPYAYVPAQIVELSRNEELGNACGRYDPMHEIIVVMYNELKLPSIYTIRPKAG